MKNNLNILCILSVSGFLSAQQTDTENYIYTKNCLDADCIKKTEAVQYFDGLGRPKQSIAIKASPEGKDVVSHIEYDRYGRVSKSYLPVPQTETRNGGIYENPLGNASDPGIYGNEKIYSEQIIENSPLERVKQSFGIGNAWNGKPVNFNYSTNSTADGVKKYPLTTAWTEGRSNSVPGIPIAFAPNTLMKTSITDEDGNTVTEFKNGKGQTLLVRKNDGSVNSDTYYVYDQYGRLAYVIPPLASVSSSLDQAVLDNLCYQYRYDGLGRLVEKKLPGKGWEYMVYDKADRLILTRDANLKKDGKWMITKYDQLGRVLYTGMISAGERPALQDLIKNLTITESRSTGGFTKNGMIIYYTNDYFTVDITSVLSINYYDSYPQGAPAVPGQIQAQDVLQETGVTVNTMSLPLASYVKNIEDDNWTLSYMYYDTKGRSIGAYSVNHLGGFTRAESQLDFAGMIKKTVTRHKRLDTDAEKVITENFTYDDQGRLLVHKHQVDNGPEEILAQNTYNKLSQLETKKVGGTNPGSPLQTINYQYNIRGWLTKINDPANLNGKLFGYEIKYQNPVYTSKAPGRFNGNITEVDWKNSSENVLKRYTYAYDGLNRLKDAFYAEPDVTNPHNGNYDEYLTYDLNGNIKTLKRKAFPIGGTTSTLVDDLEYQYTGNRLNQVIESAMNDTGYEGGNNIISYDLNGSMTDLKDKGIQSVVYNHLDLPNTFSITHTGPLGAINYSMDYLYRADGTKLRKTYSYIGSRGSAGSVRKTDYLDGFQYSYFESGVSCETCRPESAFEEKAYKGIGFPGTGTPTWTLDFVPTSEGFYSFTENRYIYQYRDHLGNVRISFAKNSTGTIDITDTNNYYPFGLNHIDGQISKGKFGSYQSYKYNGKELQETGMFDYGARFYMPDLGRWGVMDPLAETSRAWSPYRYAYNNPLRFIDPDGRKEKKSTVDTMLELGGSWTNTGSGFSNGVTTLDYDNPAYYSFSLGTDKIEGIMGYGSPSFQFDKNMEKFYKKKYPEFYDFVMETLPKIVNDDKFMSVLSKASGFSIEELTKMFKSDTNYGLIGYNEIEYSTADYPHGTDPQAPINLVRINVDTLNWFKTANRDTKTIEGITNIVQMTSIIGHEINHWGVSAGTNSPFRRLNLDGDPGTYFERKLMNTPQTVGPPGKPTESFNAYIRQNFKTLYKIFN